VFLKRAYSNQISWLWHIKIPYAYWDKRYPKSQHKDEVARMALIQKDMDEIEGSLTGTANANKAIFSHYAANASGKPEENVSFRKRDFLNLKVTWEKRMQVISRPVIFKM
jgi:hypothetical protein